MEPASADSIIEASTTTSAQTDTMLPAPAPDAPVTYKIVKVRKPDGTIVKVKRRITEAQGDATVPKPAPELSPDVSTTVSTQKVTRVQGDATVPEFAPNALSKVSMQVTFPKTTQAVSKGIVVPEASSSQTLTPKAAEKPSRDVKPKRTSKDGAKQRLTPARTYRLFRDVHRLHRAVETFDASGDLGDIRDDANDLESDPYSELSNSSSSDDDSKSRKSNDHGRKKNSFSKQKGDSSSVLSYHDSDSEYQQSDSDNNENQNQRQGASVRNNVSAGHSTNHTTTRETTSVRRQMMSVPRAREQHTTDASAKRSKSEVIINEKELGNEYDSEVVKARRRQFRKLKRRSRVAQSVVWGIMIVFPILFIVLGIFTALLNGVAAESWKGFAMTEAIKGAVTAWPIIFAAILAQSLKTFASYKVERGLRLMTLEQLISSHSVGAAIKQPFFLRNVNGLAIALLCLWSLSPLASQALQRMSYLDFVSNNATISVPYLDTTGSNSIFSSSVLAIVDDAAAETQGLYASSLMAPAEIQNSPLDTWNNTKIPLLEPLMEGFSTMSNGWYAVNVNEASQFSSLLGVPIEIPVDTRAKIPYEAKYSDLEMVMQSAYLTISDCTPQIIQTQQEINHTILQSTTMSVSPSGTLIMSLKLLGDNTTVMGVGQLARLPGILTFSSDTGGHLTTGKTADGNDITESLYSYTACKMTQAFVDSQVSCSGDQCRVIGMRPSLNVTQLSNFVGFYGDGPAFIESFVNATGSFWPGAYTFTESYINNPNVGVTTSFSEARANISAVPLPAFQQRLALLLNTYWQTGFAPTNQTDGLSDTVSAQNGNNENGNVKFASAVYYEMYYAYVTSWAWLAVLFASSVILLVAGTASAYLDAQTIGPDVLGFASSMTRNNKYMDLPKEDSTMSGPERARLLADVKVMMQDVKPGSGVGKIALGTVSEGTERLKPGRLYR